MKPYRYIWAFKSWSERISMFVISFFLIGSSYSSLHWQVRQHITFNLISHKPSNTDTIYTLSAHCVYMCVFVRERDHGLSEMSVWGLQYCELMLFDVLTMRMGQWVGGVSMCEYMCGRETEKMKCVLPLCAAEWEGRSVEVVWCFNNVSDWLSVSLLDGFKFQSISHFDQWVNTFTEIRTEVNQMWWLWCDYVCACIELHGILSLKRTAVPKLLSFHKFRHLRQMTMCCYSM